MGSRMRPTVGLLLVLLCACSTVEGKGRETGQVRLNAAQLLLQQRSSASPVSSRHSGDGNGDGPAEVRGLLHGWGMASYADLFIEQGFDKKENLYDMTRQEMLQIGVKRGHAKELLRKLGPRPVIPAAQQMIEVDATGNMHTGGDKDVTGSGSDEEKKHDVIRMFGMKIDDCDEECISKSVEKMCRTGPDSGMAKLLDNLGQNMYDGFLKGVYGVICDLAMEGTRTVRVVSMCEGRWWCLRGWCG